MDEQYENHESKIPLYLSGRMDEGERVDFETSLGTDSELRDEVERSRPVFDALQADFARASDTRFELTEARRTELIRESGVNVVSFGSEIASKPPSTKIVLLTAYQKWSSAAAVAAALLLGAVFGFNSGVRQYRQVDVASQPVSETLANTEIASEVASHVHVYPLGYGLDRDESWRFRSASAAGFVNYTDKSSGDGSRSDEPPYFFGLEGPRPYYEFDLSQDPEAI